MQHPTHIGTVRVDSPHNRPAGVAATASRFFVSMRKSFTPPRRKVTENSRAAMYSTPEERHACNTSRASRLRPCFDSRPTIEQISVGLHVSRTPHLSPIPNRHPIPSHPGSSRSLDAPFYQFRVSSVPLHHTQYRTRHSLPPAPPRSSMKKTNTSVSTLDHPPQHPLSSGMSSSTFVVDPGGPVTPGSSRPLSSLRTRVSKFVPGYRPLSLPSSLGRASSFTSSASDSTRPATPRKAVRFSTSVLAIDEQS